MFEFLPLHIFPGGGFDQSILPVVYLGLLCLWFFAETFGFIFIGLIVPGYLTAVAIIAPASAAVVCLESLVTYGVVWGLSDGLGKRGFWSPFFGRDRFFAFLVVSVIVRLVGGLWLWPTSWEWLTTRFGLSAAPPGPLSSLGLVLVPLTANMFWKIGVFRGAWQILLPSALTYGLTTYLLVPFTNLRFSEFRLNFEDVAVDLLSSSRTYIVLLVAAALSARLNKRYGWDFGGILVPALLAVTWYTPTKAAMTFAEVAVLASAASLIVTAPVVRNWNLEGPRRLILIFTTAFLLKYLSSWAIVAVAPSVRMTDFFAFGYLLSSLIALKIIQKDVASTVIPTAAVSLVGFVAGSLVAVGIETTRLSSVPPAPVDSSARSTPATRPALRALVRRASLLEPISTARPPISADHLRHLESIGKRLRQSWGPEGGATTLDGLTETVREIGLEWTAVEGPEGATGYLLSEPLTAYPRTGGYGMYWFRPDSHGPIVEVPSPPRDAVHVLGLYAIARAVDARALMFGTPSKSPDGQMVAPRRSTQTPFHRIHRTLADLPIVQFRVGTRNTDSQMFVRHRLDHTLPTEALEKLMGSIPVSWDPPRDLDRQRESAEATFTSIRLDADDLLQAAEHFANHRPDENRSMDDPEQVPTERPTTLQRHLEGRLLGADRRVAGSIAALAQSPTPAELNAAARSLIGRLARMARTPEPSWREDRILASLRVLAPLFHLELTRLQPEASEGCYWELSEPERPLRGMGLMMVRCQAEAPVLVEVPKPLGERSTWRAGALLAEALDARGLLIGSWSRSRKEGLPRSAFEAPSMYLNAHRWLQRNYLAFQVPWTLQIRGLGRRHGVDGDLLISGDAPMWPSSAPPALRALETSLQERGLETAWDRGRPRFADLRGFPDATARYTGQVAGDRFARLWFTAPFRDILTPGPSPDEVRSLLERRGLAWETRPIGEALARTDREPEASVEQLEATAGAQATPLSQFGRTLNPVHLTGALDAFESIGAAPRLVLDPVHEQVWLVASASTGEDSPPAQLAIRLRAHGKRDAVVELDRPAMAGELRLMTASRIWVNRPDQGDPDDD